MSATVKTPLPDFYYAIFRFFEPFLCVMCFFGTLADPKAVHDQQAPWPASGPPPGPLPKASFVTVIQLSHVCALMGLCNFFVLRAVRTHLAATPALQEKILTAYLTPLLIGDVAHLWITLWALGDDKWNISQWTSTLWATILFGLALLIPRAAWHMGIGRYVSTRDDVAKTRETDYCTFHDASHT